MEAVTYLDNTHRESVRAIKKIRVWVERAHANVAAWDLPEYVPSKK